LLNSSDLREATGGATQDVVKQAEVNVAKANNQSVEEIQRSVQEALAESRAAVAAAGDDQVKLVAALEKLIDAEKAVGHENEAIEAMQRLQKTLDRDVDSEKWATVTDRLLYALKQRSPLNDEPVERRKEAVEWARTAPKLGEEHPATLELMRGLTSYLPTEEGIAMERIIARAQEKRLGPDAPETLKALRNLAISLGGVAEEEGDEAAADEADQLYRKILEIQTRKHGRFSVQVVNLTVNRSEFLLSVGRGEEAEKELEALISGIEGEKGKEDSLLTGLLSMMADIKEEAEDASSALALRRRIIAIEEMSGGKDSDDVLVSKANLAVSILDTGEEGLLGEAERLLREVLDARERLIGSSQPRTWVTFQNLAVCLRRKGDLKGAIDLEFRRLEEMKKALGEDDAGVISEFRIIGDELSQEDDEESQRAGVALLQEALESADRRLPPDSEEIVSLLAKVGSHLIGLDEFERAETFVRREVELREQHHAEDSEALSLACFGMFRIMKRFKRMTKRCSMRVRR
jgi:tetratricopeptide (TPR) repeat protein